MPKPFAIIAPLIVGWLSSHASAVATSHWVHTSQSDFKAGTLSNVVATNLGDLKLSRRVELLLGQDPRVSAVYSLVQTPDGTTYAGTGPEGVLLKIKDQTVTTAAQLGDNLSILSLAVDARGRLLLGTGGERGQLFRIEKPDEKPQPVFSADGVQYIWSIVTTPDGSTYLATGPNGLLYEIRPDGTHQMLFDSDENNLLSMIFDGKESLYAGTDPNGLVYRINRKSGQTFVSYDAAETEISSLAIDARGNVYAATAQATEPSPDEPSELRVTGGRPETSAARVPIPSDPPSMPQPPDLPKPSPGEPLPIPRAQPEAEIQHGPGTAPSVPPEPVAIEAPAESGHEHVGNASATSPAPDGNAIYRIDPDGFVTEIFRQPVMVFSIVERNGTLIAGTGNAGEIYQVNPGADEVSVLAKVDSGQVMTLLLGRDQQIWLGMANSGEIGVAGGGFAPSGTWISPVLDATQISRFGKMHLRGSLPTGTKLLVSTRSGNVQEESGPGWSNWSDGAPAAEFLPVAAPSARFLQYRVTFSTDDPQETPVVESVDVAYQLPNLPPSVKSITVAAADPSAKGSATQLVTWEASDPNDDTLVHKLYFRSSTRGNWILLKERLSEPTFEWTTRNVADGTYQIRAEASDAPSNPPDQARTSSRVSDPVIVDNTPPVIGDLKFNTPAAAPRSLEIELRAVDRTSIVSGLAYSVNSAVDWQQVLPLDNIADSPQEAYRFTVPNLSPGVNQITVRATDSPGNAAFETVNVTIRTD